MAFEALEPTFYELRGDGGTQVDYATTDIDGRARLLYVGPHGERSYRAGEIDVRDTELGREVTVTLECATERDAVNLTVLIPPVRLDEQFAAPLDTVAVVTTMLTSLAGAPRGQDYHYEIFRLTGEALVAPR